MKAAEFGCVVKHYQNPLFRYFLVGTRNHAIAEELTQETFLKVWKERGKYDSERLFSAWLFSIARNLLIDHKRREKLRNEGELTQIKEHTPTEDFEDLHQALEYLTPDERLMIKMRYFEQRSCQEIANSLRKTDNAISVHLHKIRQKISDFLTRRENAK